jgi:hypothetical protein
LRVDMYDADDAVEANSQNHVKSASSEFRRQ